MNRNRKMDPKIIAATAVAVVIALFAAVTLLPGYMQQRTTAQQEPESQSELASEAPVHTATIYKSAAADVAFEKKYLKSDREDITELSVAEDEMVTLIVTATEGWTFDSVKIIDHDLNEVSEVTQSNPDGTWRINFVMPQSDIVLNFNYLKEEEETDSFEAAQTEVKDEPQSESEVMEETEAEETESESRMPYGLSLHNLTVDIIASYNGQFDDVDFLQQLGGALELSSDDSEYKDVTDVYFSQEEYSGESEDGKIFHYVYFNADPEWMILATYYTADGKYLFTEMPDETEAPAVDTTTAAASAAGTGTVQSQSGTTSAPNAASASDDDSEEAYGEAEVSLDILSVSSIFLNYVSSQDEFYEEAINYVAECGLTGEITGTMESYNIDAGSQRAEIKVLLNNGSSFACMYEKATGEYEFSGLD